MSKAGFQILFLLAALCTAHLPAFADGGTLQFRKAAGPFTITLFSAPVPLRAGTADLSVLVQDAEDNALVDGAVTLRLSKPGEQEITAEATTAQATNKLLYAAHVELPTAGQWHVNVQVQRDRMSGAAKGEMTVLPEEPPIVSYWFYFALVPLGVLLFALNQWLKRRQRGFSR